MEDGDDDWPSGGHQQEAFGLHNNDFTSLVPTRAIQTIPLERRHEIELSRPSKPPINPSTLRHELIHPSVSEEDMFKDAVQVRKRRVEEYDQERERKRYTAKANINGPKELVGICIQMCPKWDRLRRANNKSAISTYEVDENGYFGESRAVKSWHRPAAGDAEDLPEDLRTEETLMKTMDYLVHDIIDKWSFGGCQTFIWDRTRSIRQDCSIQGLNSDAVIGCYERIARFHILSLQQLSHNENFQRGQELEQLSKTLISLNELYDDRRRLIKQGKRQYNQETDYEAEFRAYTLVSNLYSPLQIARAIKLPSRITEAPILKIALQLFKFAQRANHDDKNLFGNTSRSEATLNWSAQFFDLVYDPAMPYLLACLAAVEFMNVKKGAIKTFERGFPPQKTASSLNLLRELVDAPSELDVKTAVERYGLKTNEHNGALYMDTPRKSQRSTWIAQPPPISPPFQLAVERKRGEAINGQFVPARLFIDEPGCYRRVVSQLCGEEVDISYHDPVEHKPTDGPAHIVQFASSWESVGTIVHDLGDNIEDDSPGNALFDLIQNTRNGNVPKGQLENLVGYMKQRQKKGRKTFPPPQARTFQHRAEQAPRQQQQFQPQQVPSAFRGFGKPETPASTTSTPPLQPQGQFQPPAASSVFPSAVPTRENTPLLSQDIPSAPQAPGPSAFGVRPPPVSAFGGPVSAFGSRPVQAPAFGAKTVGAAPAFGTRVGTPPLSAFGQKPAEKTSTFASAFGEKSGSVPAFRTGSPAPSGTPPAAPAFPSTTNVFPAAAPPPSSVFTFQKQVDPPAATEKEQPASLFDVKPAAPVSVFNQKPATTTHASEIKPSPVSLFNQKVGATQQPQDVFVDQNQQPPRPFPQTTSSNLNPAVPSFVSQPETKPSTSIFDQPNLGPPQSTGSSIFDARPPTQPSTSFFPTSTPEIKQSPSHGQVRSLFDSAPAREPVAGFFPEATPAIKPPASLLGFSSTTPQVPPPPSLFTPVSTTPHVPPPQLSIFDTTKPKSPLIAEQNTSKAPDSQRFDESEPIEFEKPESPKPRLAPSGLPLEEDLPDSHDLPPPQSFTYRDVVQPIAPEFFRKLDTSRDSEPWYPGLECLDKFKYNDILELARYRQNLEATAWHPLKLTECDPDGLPALLEQPAPDTWQLQIVCADQSRKSLDWFMNKFEHLVERDGENTYRDIHVASTHRRGQDGCIGGIIFGCTAPSGKDSKELKKVLRHDKGVLKRTITNAFRLAPKGKLQVVVLAYRSIGKTKAAQTEYLRKSLEVEEFEEGGKIVVTVLLLEVLDDLEKLHKMMKKFGVGLVEKRKQESNGNGEPLLALSVVSAKNPEVNGNGTKKRELDDLEAQTAKLLLDADSNAMKRRRYVEEKKPVYIYGLPAFETPLKKAEPQQQQQQQRQQTQKRKPTDDVSDKKKRKIKAATDHVSKALSSVSAKFDAWALPDGDDDLMLGKVLLEEFMNDLGKQGF
ncbi:hypothetical protein H072_3754 [Dactylellina haptotyla CBS 200.50]|uniref:SAC3/GANP/THP3 conserved domain-containing protein n=1 Tax=Dactylellina haptotyla (strain CBS 200.50) TaxID=1284197 RepID=S8BS10_DACHA|nr:hypothetical protein H072_3754 [Dactylellina haptotyla CBS 200.50]